MAHAQQEWCTCAVRVMELLLGVIQSLKSQVSARGPAVRQAEPHSWHVASRTLLWHFACCLQHAAGTQSAAPEMGTFRWAASSCSRSSARSCRHSQRLRPSAAYAAVPFPAVAGQSASRTVALWPKPVTALEAARSAPLGAYRTAHALARSARGRARSNCTRGR